MNTRDIARLDARIDRLAEHITELLVRLDNHLDNHHGPASRIKQSGLTAIVAALLLGAWEVVRQLVL